MVLLSVWTLFVWGGRVRNIVADPELSQWGAIWRLSLAGSFVLLALALGASLVSVAISSKISNDWPYRAKGALIAQLSALALGGWGISVWVVRGVDISFGNHPLGFKVVHAILAVVTIGLSAWTWLVSANRSRPEATQVDK